MYHYPVPSLLKCLYYGRMHKLSDHTPGICVSIMDTCTSSQTTHQVSASLSWTHAQALRPQTRYLRLYYGHMHKLSDHRPGICVSIMDTCTSSQTTDQVSASLLCTHTLALKTIICISIMDTYTSSQTT